MLLWRMRPTDDQSPFPTKLEINELKLSQGDLDKELKLKYFRLKHELTDASMREIFAARATKAKK